MLWTLEKLEIKFPQKGVRVVGATYKTPPSCDTSFLKVLKRENQPGVKRFYDQFIKNGGRKRPEAFLIK